MAGETAGLVSIVGLIAGVTGAIVGVIMQTVETVMRATEFLGLKTGSPGLIASSARALAEYSMQVPPSKVLELSLGLSSC